MEREEKILQIAIFVRETIEQNRDFQSDKSCNILEFPKNRCDYASWILWKLLRQNGISWFRKIYARWTYRHKNFMHVWLEDDNYALDITCDQFNGWWKDWVFDKVILIPKDEHYFSRMRRRKLNYHDREESLDSIYDSYILNPSFEDFNIIEYYNTFFDI